MLTSSREVTVIVVQPGLHERLLKQHSAPIGYDLFYQLCNQEIINSWYLFYTFSILFLVIVRSKIIIIIIWALNLNVEKNHSKCMEKNRLDPDDK